MVVVDGSGGGNEPRPPLFVSSPDLELPQYADLPRRPLGAEASCPSLAQVTANR